MAKANSKAVSESNQTGAGMSARKSIKVRRIDKPTTFEVFLSVVRKLSPVSQLVIQKTMRAMVDDTTFRTATERSKIRRLATKHDVAALTKLLARGQIDSPPRGKRASTKL